MNFNLNEYKDIKVVTFKELQEKYTDVEQDWILLGWNAGKFLIARRRENKQINFLSGLRQARKRGIFRTLKDIWEIVDV